MNPSKVVPAVVASAVLLIAGCSDDDSKTSATASSSTSVETPSSPAGSSASTASSSSSTQSSASTTLAVATDKKLNKPIIVDGSGKAVYLYEPEGNSTTSQVPAGIKGNWPPVTASGSATVSADLDSSKVGTSTQSDGTTQVTYNGHLLYLFVGDTAPAEANGQALGGIWFVLSPDGEKIA